MSGRCSRPSILAQIVPTRRCNLDCAYCNEYDKLSQPVPFDVMLQRIDRLAELGTTIITLSGGEPMLHPDLDAMIRRIRKRGAIATLIINGYLLTWDRIQRLNRAGLDYMQISINNVLPDETSKKSLKVLDRKLSLKMGERQPCPASMAQGSLAIQSEKRNRGIMFGYCERLPRRILYSLEDALRRHTGCIAFLALAVFEGLLPEGSRWQAVTARWADQALIKKHTPARLVRPAFRWRHPKKRQFCLEL